MRAEAPQRGGTFRTAQDAPSTLDPACVDDVYEATIVNQLFDGLLAFDKHLNTVPCIASSWIVSPDGTSYSFQLRDGLVFHDGRPVTAEDVAYSYQRVFDLSPDESSLAREYLSHIAGTTAYRNRQADRIAGIEVVSPHEIRITLEHPYASFLAVLASEMTRIVPKHYVVAVGDSAFARRPVGSGPFQFTSWRPGGEVVLARFPRYRLRPAKLDSLIFELPEANARSYAAEAFLAGRLGAVLVPNGRLREFQSRPQTRVLTRQGLSLSFIGLNQKRRPFDDVRVRQAFALAIDREALVAADASARIRSNGVLPPGMPGYTPETKALERDLERARQLLASAGYPSGRGLPTIVYTSASQTESARAMIAAIAAQVAEVGFRLRVETLDWLAFSHRLDGRELQCFSVTWVADIPDPDSFLYPLFHSSGSANFANYRNSLVDGLLETARCTRGSMARLQAYRDAERRVLNDAPVVPLFHPLSAVAIQSNVQGFEVTAMGYGNVAFENVWLRAEPAAAEAARTQVRTTTQGRVP